MKFEFAPWNSLRQAAARPQEPENLRFIAEVYWRALLGFALVVVLCSIWYGISTLQGVSTGVVGGGVVQVPPPPLLDRAKLDTAVSGFSARAERYQSLQSAPPSIPSPL